MYIQSAVQIIFGTAVPHNTTLQAMQNMKTLPVNRNFYFFANFFLALGMASGIFHSVISMQVGPQMFLWESFLGWFLLVNILTLAGLVLTLNYYKYKAYRITFFAGSFAAIAGLCHVVIKGTMLFSLGAMKSYLFPTLLLSLGAGVVYSLTLSFSKTRERFWLRIAGFFTFVIASILITTLILSSTSQDLGVKNAMEKIAQWTVLVAGFAPVFFILNFLSEVKSLKTGSIDSPMPKSIETGLSSFGIIAFTAMIGFGVMIGRQSYYALYGQNRNAEKTHAFAQKCEARTFGKSNGDSLKYLLMKPLGYDPQKKYPLVVSLPYDGYEASAGQLLASDMYRSKYPAFIFVPYCPKGAGWGGIPNYPTIDTLVFDAILALEEEVSIDPKRRYVTGVSRGGFGSWHFISTRPDMFAAAIPVCGGGDPQQAAKIVDVSVWAFHGEVDKNAPVKGSRDMISAMKQAGRSPVYTEYKNEAHSIWNLVIDTPGVWDWLFAQKKK